MEVNMQIRLMDMNDYDGVYRLWINTPGMGLNTDYDSKDGILKYITRNPTTCFVAEKDNEIIGVILSGHDGRRGYIHHTPVKVSERKGACKEKVKPFLRKSQNNIREEKRVQQTRLAFRG
jgi:ribosomal protein S18 acetylase RimI-like enzyme